MTIRIANKGGNHGKKWTTRLKEEGMGNDFPGAGFCKYRPQPLGRALLLFPQVRSLSGPADPFGAPFACSRNRYPSLLGKSWRRAPSALGLRGSI